MENAPRALLMAATMIIAVMLLVVFVHLFQAGANLHATYELEQTKNQLILYNGKFELYNREENSIMDVISVVNLAYSINDDCLFDTARAVEVVVKAGSQYFILPRKEPPLVDGERIGRNKIYSVGTTYTENMTGTKIISVYDLVDKTMKDLNINVTGRNDDDKLSTSKLGSSVTQNSYGEDVTRYNATVYKYLFKCTGIDYNQSLGRVIRINFELTGKNSNWDN